MEKLEFFYEIPFFRKMRDETLDLPHPVEQSLLTMIPTSFFINIPTKKYLEILRKVLKKHSEPTRQLTSATYSHAFLHTDQK